VFNYGDTLKGIRTFFWVFQVKGDAAHDLPNDYWKFRTSELWDEFFYSSFVQPIMRSENHIIG
jgi:hypothetical protein